MNFLVTKVLILDFKTLSSKILYKFYVLKELSEEMYNQIGYFYMNLAIFDFFFKYVPKRIVSIKRTVSKLFQISQLNVQYDLKS